MGEVFMQLVDRFRGMNKIYVVLVCFTLLLIISGFLMFGYSNSNKSNEGEYYDPLSKQTVSDPPGKTPENFGGAAYDPLFLGFDKLIDRGLSSDQMNILDIHMKNFLYEQSPPAKEVSLEVDSIKSQKNSGERPTFYISFNIRTDRKNDFNARLEYSDISTVRLLVYSKETGKLVFDSFTDH